MSASVDKLLSGLPRRSVVDGEENASWSEQADRLATWFSKRQKLSQMLAESQPEVAEHGANMVAYPLIVAVTQAFDAEKIRARDYRKLLSIALDASTMNDVMVKKLAGHFADSPTFRLVLKEHANSFTGHGYQMEQNYLFFMNLVAPEFEVPK
jgi:hypothetical protein